jgi:hypothetical protein
MLARCVASSRDPVLCLLCFVLTALSLLFPSPLFPSPLLSTQRRRCGGRARVLCGSADGVCDVFQDVGRCALVTVARGGVCVDWAHVLCALCAHAPPPPLYCFTAALLQKLATSFGCTALSSIGRTTLMRCTYVCECPASSSRLRCTRSVLPVRTFSLWRRQRCSYRFVSHSLYAGFFFSFLCFSASVCHSLGAQQGQTISYLLGQLEFNSPPSVAPDATTCVSWCVCVCVCVCVCLWFFFGLCAFCTRITRALS